MGHAHIFVTGGTGYLGRPFIARLLDHALVCVGAARGTLNLTLSHEHWRFVDCC